MRLLHVPEPTAVFAARAAPEIDRIATLCAKWCFWAGAGRSWMNASWSAMPSMRSTGDSSGA